MLTTAQLSTLKAAILAETDAAFVAARTAGSSGEMADWFNVIAAPSYFVRRSSLSRHDIFSGTGAAAVANRTHILAMSRREAKRGEKVFAVGLGTGASPSVMGFEGDVTISDIDNALRLA